MPQTDPAQPQGRSVEVDGARLYWEETGAGYPLLLLHGGLESGRTWAHLVPELASGFRVITVDVRGHGRSTNPAGELTYPRIAADLAELIDAVSLDPPFVVGWSDGGQHALHLALRSPRHVRAFVAGAADYRRTPESEEWVRDFFGVDASGRADLARVEQSLGASYPRFRGMHAGGDEQWRALVDQTARLWRDYPGLSSDEFRRITRPALVLVGDRDDGVPVEDAVAMYRALPNAELAVRAHGTHSLPWQQPAWFVETVTEFLSRH